MCSFRMLLRSGLPRKIVYSVLGIDSPRCARGTEAFVETNPGARKQGHESTADQDISRLQS